MALQEFPSFAYLSVMKSKRQVSKWKSLEYRGTECLNCGHPLDRSDRYCPYCSQANSTKKLTAGDYFSEFLSSILVYDSRLRYTLRDIFRPGLMTLNYSRGQRLKYANPFRFFLSVSIIYFLLNSVLSELFFEQADFQVQFAAYDNSKAKTPPTFILEERGDTLKAKQLGMEQYFSESALQEFPFMERFLKRSAIYLDYLYNHPQENAKTAIAKMNHAPTQSNLWTYSRMGAIKKIRENTEEFMSYFRAKFPFLLFFFAPVFALVLLFIYRKKEVKYMDHLIFLFHIFSFFFLINMLFLIPNLLWFGSSIASLLMFGILSVYFFLALRRFYGESGWRTFFNTILLSLVFNISFLIAILIFVAGSLAVY
ncbi:MAG TPA: DUF3667 domain-containing protein [Flavobacteriaceae bacterium]|nr:DUF3667 domain-containing protein [Flavobacteriaceae bacterium]